MTAHVTRAWQIAEEINDSDALMKVYAAPEWDCLSDDGKAWVAALIGETLRRAYSNMAYFGASDGACYEYPGADQQELRDAFCRGAAFATIRAGEEN